MLTTTDIQKFSRFLNEAHTCAIIGHINPDGDAMGSALGLRRYIQAQYPQMTLKVILPNKFPNYFLWMDGAKDAMIFTDNKKQTTDYLSSCELIICVDFNTLSRLEELGTLVPQGVRKVLIDHHPQPDTTFDLIFSDITMCSTSEFVYCIIDAAGNAKTLDAVTAELLYAGIFSDTGGFAYGIRTPQTFRIIADLLEAGVDKDAVANRIFDSYSVNRMRLMGYVLKDKMKVFEDRRVAYTALSRQELDQYCFETGDTEGFVNLPLSIKSVILSAFFYESADNSHIRVSLRSKGKTLSADSIARQYFNGGGHFNAAGGKFYGKLQECCSFFEDILQKICTFVVFLCLVQCSPDEIKPYTAAVSMEKQQLQQANVYWSKREYDVLHAFIYRQELAVEQQPSGYYLQIIKKGKGKTAKNGSIVAAEAQIWLLDGTLCYEYGAEQPMIMTIGKSGVMSGLHTALNGLSEGTEALILLSSHLGYGLLGDRNKIPPQSPLLCKIKIASVE